MIASILNCFSWMFHAVIRYAKNFLVVSMRPHCRKPGGGFFGWLVVRFFRTKMRQYLIQQAVRHCDIQPSDSVLELGFGPGFGLKFAAECVKFGTGKVYGLDYSPAMVEEAKEFMQRENLEEKVEIKLGDVHELPYADESMDIIFHVNCYYFWDDRQKAMTEIHRVLKNGGKMVTVFFTNRLAKAVEDGLLTKEEADFKRYMDELKLYNFCDVKMEEFEPEFGSCGVIFASKSNRELGEVQHPTNDRE